MASRGRGYDYGAGDSGAGGKIRRRPASRAAAASPYARPPSVTAPAPAAGTAAAQGGGWFSRLVSAGASRLLPSLFRKPPPQVTAPPPPPETLDATHSRPEGSQEPLLLRQDVGPAFLQMQLEPPSPPPSPPPPPLEDDLPEGEENVGDVANNLSTESSVKDEEDKMLRNSGDHSLTDLQDLLKQRTFKRNEFEYLAELLWSRTIGSKSFKPDDGSTKEMHASMKETGSRNSSLPVDFAIRPNSVSDLVASPAEIAKAYMSSKSADGSPLRLRLHDPSSITIKSMETNTIQQAKPPTIPLQGSRLHTFKNSDRFKSNSTTPIRSAIYKMSSPYFKTATSEDLSGSIPSPYRTPSSVHTFGRQVLKRKSTVNNEVVSVGPIRKMRQRQNRLSPLLETRSGYRRHIGSHGNKFNEDSEHSAQAQKRLCLSKVGDPVGGLYDRALATSFCQAPVQSTEMAAKILKQLDTLVPSQKEDSPEIKHKHGNVMDVEAHVSQRKEVSVQSNNLSECSVSGNKNHSLLNGISGNDKFTPAAVNEKTVDATNSQISSLKNKPPTFSLRSHPPNLTLSSEVDGNKMPSASNGFTFPVPAAVGSHSQAPPTPTMASPPMLPIEKRQSSAVSNASVTSVESGPRMSKSVLEEGSIAQKCDKKLIEDVQLMSSKSSGQVPSFTCNPVFKFANSKLATSNNGIQHTQNTMASDILPANGSNGLGLSQISSSYTISSNSASASAQNSSIGGSFTISSFGTSSFSALGATAQSFATPSLASSGGGSSSSSAPLSFFPKFGTASSFAAQDKSKAGSAEPTFCSGNINTLFAQSSASNLSFKPSEKSSSSNFQSLAKSPVVSAPLSSAFSASSLFSSAAGSGSTSVTAAVTTNGTMFGLPSNSSATSSLSSVPSAVFSFTAATPSIPNSSPTTPIFGGVSPATGSGIGEMNGGNMITDRKESPYSTTSPFGIPTNSPSTPIFSSPATQFSPTTSALSSGGFSLGPSGGNDNKSGRKFIRVKRKK